MNSMSDVADEPDDDEDGDDGDEDADDAETEDGCNHGVPPTVTVGTVTVMFGMVEWWMP